MTEIAARTAPSPLDSHCLTPVLVTGGLVQLLRNHFSDNRNLLDPYLRETPDFARDYVWRPGEDTGILIESATRWRPELAGARPAVLVKRGGWSVSGERLLPGCVQEDGSIQYSRVIHGSHAVYCLAGESGEAERLGQEVFHFFTGFEPVIARSFRFSRFQVTQLGPLTQLKEAANTYAVVVNVGYAFEYAWRLREQVPVLKRISFEATILEEEGA